MRPFQALRMRNAAASGGGNPYGFVAAGSPVRTNNTSTLNLPYPAGLAANDILIATITVLPTSGTPSITVPSGWTLEATVSINATAYRHYVLWKRATGSESGTENFTVTMAGSTNGSIFGAMSNWGGCVATGSPIVDLKTATGESSFAYASSLPAPSITTTAADQVVVNLIATDGTPTATPPAGYTEAFDYQHTTPGNACTAGCNFKAYASAGATGTQNTTLSSANRWSVVTFGLLAA